MKLDLFTCFMIEVLIAFALLVFSLFYGWILDVKKEKLDYQEKLKELYSCSVMDNKEEIKTYHQHYCPNCGKKIII